MVMPKHRHKAYNWLACCALNEPELFADLVRVVVSEQSLEEIDLDSVRVLSSKHFTEEGQETISDVIASLEVAREGRDNRRELIVVVEHKSNHDRNTAAQMAGYMHEAGKRHSAATWMLPVVLYNGKKREWTYPLEPMGTASDRPVPQEINLPEHVVRCIFMCILVNVREVEVKRIIHGLKIEPVFYALECGRKMTDSDVKHLLVLCSRLQEQSRLKLLSMLTTFISLVHSGYNQMALSEVKIHIKNLEAEVVEKENRIMQRVPTIYEDLVAKERAIIEARERSVAEELVAKERAIIAIIEARAEEWVAKERAIIKARAEELVAKEKTIIEGRERSIAESRVCNDIVENLLKLGVDDQIIVDSTGLTIESVLEMKRKLNGA